MRSTLISGGWVADLDNLSVTRSDVLLEGNVIAAVAPSIDAPPGAPVVDASGALVMPGLVNAHTHAHNTLSRGSAHSWTLEDLLLRAPALQGGRTYQDHYLSAAVNALDMLRCGCTSAIDAFAGFPAPSLEQVSAVVQAYTDVGLRAVLAPALADLPFYTTVPGLAGLLPAEARDRLGRTAPPRPAELLELAETAHQRWDGAGDGRITIGLAPAIPTQCSDELLDGCAQLAAGRGMPVQTHLSESKSQAVQARSRWGHSATTELARLGLLTERFVGAHGVWLAPDDLPPLRDADATICHNPASNLRLGSGLAPVREMLDHGVRVALGTDGSASSDNQDIFGAMRLAGLLGGIRRPYATTAWVAAVDVLRMAMPAGGHAMGQPDRLGAVRAGRLADLTIVRLDAAGLTPAVDVLNALVYAASGAGVDTVVVDGRIVLRDGRPVLVDEAELRRQAQAAAQRLAAENRDTMRACTELAPYLAAACAELPAFDIGFDRYATCPASQEGDAS